jgi:hypothetical protein
MARRGETARNPDFNPDAFVRDARKRYRPGVEKMMRLFDGLPRRPDEKQWRSALVEDLLDIFQDALRDPGVGEHADLADMEEALRSAGVRAQARIRAALMERQGAAPEPRPGEMPGGGGG